MITLKKTKERNITYQQCIDSLRDLILRTGYRNDITRKLCAGEFDLAVPFLLELIDFRHAGKQFTVV